MAWMLCFSAGVVSQLMWRQMPTSVEILALLVCGLSLCVIAFQIRLSSTQARTRLRKVGMGVLLFVVGITWAQQSTRTVLQSALPEVLDGVGVELKLVVAGLPEQRSIGSRKYQRVLFDVLSLRDESGQLCGGVRGWVEVNNCGHSFPVRVRLNDYQHTQFGFGETWQLKAKLRIPRNFANPGSFDYLKSMRWQNIGATGYVRDAPLPLRLAGAELTLAEGVRQSRLTFFDSVAHRLHRSHILRALLLGDRRFVDTDSWGLFARTGTTHLMAISGMHIAVAASLAVVVVRCLCSLWPQLTLLLPRPLFCSLLAFPLAAFYSTLAGYSLPTIRALIMVFCGLVVLAIGRRVNLFSAWVLAMFLVLLNNPLSVLSVGFWYSFVAVAILLWSLGAVVYRQLPAQGVDVDQSLSQRLVLGLSVWLRGLLQSQAAIFLGMAIALSVFASPIALSAPLANLIAIPVIGLFVVPAGILALLASYISKSIAVWCLIISDLVLDYLLRYLQFIDLSIIPTVYAAPLPGLACVLLVSAMITIALRGCYSPAFLACLLAVAIYLLPIERVLEPSHSGPKEGEFKLVQLDVGQGTAILLLTRQRVLLYDTGPIFSGSFSAGEAIVTPYLRSVGIGRIDLTVISHGDSDHAGGTQALVEWGKVGSWLVGPDIAAQSFPSPQSGELAVSSNPCRAGQTWEWDSVRFEILHPQSRAKYNSNDGSCVLKVSAASGKSVLVTGDISKKVEYLLLAEEGDRLRSDILVVAHHGSKSSTGGLFLDQVKPLIALVSAGFNNRYGHPHQDVIAALSSVGARLYTSSEFGAIAFTVGDGAIGKPDCGRYLSNHYWENVDNTELCAGSL